MADQSFVHLHVHTDYSLLDGACRIDRLVAKAKEWQMPAVAITDHGALFGAMKFYQAAKRFGIRPIIGCEAYVAPESRFRKEKIRGGTERDFYHLTLLASDRTGYQNLVQLASKAYLEGFYYKPRIDKELLRHHGDGLIALSGCLAGEIPQLLSRGLDEEARVCAEEYREILGKENFFFELQNHGLEAQSKVNEQLIRLSDELHIPLVATNDCHFVTGDDFHAHEVLICIQINTTIDQDRELTYTPDHYFKSPEEMRRLFAATPEAIQNTLKIASRCDLSIETGQYHLPRFALAEEKSPEEYLEEVVWEGFHERFADLPEGKKEEYHDRLRTELQIIHSMGFSGYFLIIWDLIKYAREQNIPVGPGRGSVAGSLVAYCLQITGLDPIHYGLLFERFLNPERITMPDIDIDFCRERRDAILQYVREKYGRENVAQIITFGTMAPRMTVRDVGRGLGISFGRIDRLAKLIPFDAKTVDDALDRIPKLRNEVQKHPRFPELIEISKRLEGLSRHASTHAAGVVIAPKAVTEFIPLYRSSEGDITTQYAMEEVETIGLLKMDFLGLRTLTVLKNTVESVLQTTGEEIALEDLPLNDSKTYELFSQANTTGIFQFESTGMRDLLRRLEPERFEDLIALNALYRPGPLEGGVVDEYIARRRGEKGIGYILPELEDLLHETYGIIVYQEQVMQIAQRMAGYSLGEADLLRRAMGKKKRAIMEAQRERFLKGARERGIERSKAEEIFDLLNQFAKYGFNRSHSAAYALIAYRTAYLKAHYPVHYMAALLTSEKDNTDKIVKYIGECEELGIPVKPPNINTSHLHFSPDGSCIRFGLGAIKNVGTKAVESILTARGRVSQVRSFFQFCEEIDLRLNNKRVIESLIKAGAFDSLGATRAQLFVVVDEAIERAQRIQRDRTSGQERLFEENLDADEGELPELDEWPEEQILASEKETLGFYISGHPLDRYRDLLKQFANIDTEAIERATREQRVALGGIITHITPIVSRKGEQMAFIELEDRKGRVEIIIFPELYQKQRPLLRRQAPVFIEGSLETADEGERAKILAKSLVSLDELREQKLRFLDLHLKAEKIDGTLLRQIRDLAKAHPGQMRIRLHLQAGGEEVAVQASRSFSVDPSPELRSALQALVGEGTIRYAP